ncbi:ABC-2 type transport system ATP-binding protein [Hathewaya proteolytica DSM 3090]|uniref:ABC-2 type transport system ATP-binding protein n=1 Tax=Hathewaya proteolytica DSM 3090 TaxID=1121331 RepID=A0A1M6JGY6_9CLOT|nr:ABC transporter ATP-binding protein [Hathewaya proteolytica]SHJ45950.1 ABC-2 type transport system ATP-binding protein [Hathewaya proteolytica DSM 3090]
MIEVKNAVKKYRKVRAMDDLSFCVNEGKITALLGLNGAGKSTTMKAIMGLIKLDSGEILIDGEKFSSKILQKVSLIPDVPVHYPNMTIKEMFAYMEVFYDNWSMEKAYEMLKVFKLTEDKKISELSKGNVARVKLIVGFAQCPKYLLMDEPFSGIDIFTREDFIKTMINYMNEDTTILLTTHEIKEIENLADEVILVEEGKVISQFNVEDVRSEQGLSMVDKIREVYKGEE